jgi:hypothetical protein
LGLSFEKTYVWEGFLDVLDVFSRYNRGEVGGLVIIKEYPKRKFMFAIEKQEKVHPIQS